jgi:hypothetical protein
MQQQAIIMQSAYIAAQAEDDCDDAGQENDEEEELDRLADRDFERDEDREEEEEEVGIPDLWMGDYGSVWNYFSCNLYCAYTVVYHKWRAQWDINEKCNPIFLRILQEEEVDAEDEQRERTRDEDGDEQEDEEEEEVNNHLNELRRQAMIESLIGMGFPVEWALRAAEHCDVSASESAAITWIIERMEMEQTKMDALEADSR